MSLTRKLPSALRSKPPRPRGPAWKRTLDTNGDGTGATDAIGVYSPGSPGRFWVEPAAGTVAIAGLVVQLSDQGNWDYPGYASMPPLTNGIRVVFTDTAGTEWDLTDGQPIRDTLDWEAISNSGVNVTSASGQGDLYSGWSAIRWAQWGTHYNLKPGTSLAVICEDDLSGLIYHYFTVVGYQRT